MAKPAASPARRMVSPGPQVKRSPAGASVIVTGSLTGLARWRGVECLCREMRPIPRERRRHDLAEGGFGIDVVVPVTLEHDELLRLAGKAVEGPRLLGRYQAVVLGCDEKQGARGIFPTTQSAWNESVSSMKEAGTVETASGLLARAAAESAADARSCSRISSRSAN